MPLLDGKYEIHHEHARGAGITRFDATDPDGMPVRVDWIDLLGEDEAGFERFRRLLKRLSREGRAAVQDVVGRPGAHFVAWYVVPDQAPRAHDPELEALVAAAGFDPASADVRRIDGAPRLVALPFRPGPVPDAATGDAAAGEATPAPRAPWPWPVRAWLLAATLALSAAALTLVGFLARSNDRVVVVPDVVGRAYAAVAASLADLGLTVEPLVVATADAPAGAVVASDPHAGSTLRPGRTVRVSVAVPPGSVAPTSVPQLVGQDATVVAARLSSDGLALGRTVEVHAAAPIGVVLAQSPPAGATVGLGSTIDVLASLGPVAEPTFVPDLTGLALAEARALADVAGLSRDQVIVERLPAERIAPDTVLSQSLAPYHEVARTSAVLRLVVAAPLASDTGGGLPALGGLDEASARALASGFDVRVAYLADGNLPDGVVLQSLPVGATPADGPLVLTVNARPVPIPRPAATAVVRTAEPRSLTYRWFIEPGIPPVVAEVTATTLEGERTVVDRRVVQGGQALEGTWATSYPGVVRFDLTLNHEPYGGPLRVP
ncbi:MAG: PASTA domain-containing protein [Trueperaceae bacterium]|nr:PASTA domain-containing protein [Trueperaceae bacterium]